MSALLASIQRELKHLRHDRGDLFLAVALLPLLCLLVWWIFSAGQALNLPIAVVDQAPSSSSRELTRIINAAPGINVSQRWQAATPAIDALRQRQGSERLGVYCLIRQAVTLPTVTCPIRGYLHTTVLPPSARKLCWLVVGGLLYFCFDGGCSNERKYSDCCYYPQLPHGLSVAGFYSAPAFALPL